MSGEYQDKKWRTIFRQGEVDNLTISQKKDLYQGEGVYLTDEKVLAISDIAGGLVANNVIPVVSQSRIKTIDNDYTLSLEDHVVLVDGADNTVNVTLPVATNKGKTYVIKALNITETITIVPNGSDEIEGQSSFVFSETNQAIALISDGNKWYISNNVVFDKVVSFTGGTNVTISGTYPNFIITDNSINATDLSTAVANYIPLTQKAANNGVATLDAGGKIPSSQLPNTVMEFKGNWNASTNTPTLADGSGNSGDVYLVNVAGTQNLGSGSQTFAIGDWVLYNGTIWEKSINSTDVVSVNGQQGVVVLDADDIDDTSTTHKFVTQTQINAFHPAVTIGTANGLSLSTQALSLGTASSSTTGALTNTDWTTFNNKEPAITTLPVNKGGTGQTTLAANKVLVGNGTSGIVSPNELHWDNSNKRLGINGTPQKQFHIFAGTPTIRLQEIVNDGWIDISVLPDEGFLQLHNTAGTLLTTIETDGQTSIRISGALKVLAGNTGLTLSNYNYTQTNTYSAFVSGTVNNTQKSNVLTVTSAIGSGATANMIASHNEAIFSGSIAGGPTSQVLYANHNKARTTTAVFNNTVVGAYNEAELATNNQTGTHFVYGSYNLAKANTNTAGAGSQTTELVGVYAEADTATTSTGTSLSIGARLIGKGFGAIMSGVIGIRLQDAYPTPTIVRDVIFVEAGVLDRSYVPDNKHLTIDTLRLASTGGDIIISPLGTEVARLSATRSTLISKSQLLWYTNDITLIEAGNDDAFVYTGNPLRLKWSNFDVGRGQFEFDYGDDSSYAPLGADRYKANAGSASTPAYGFHNSSNGLYLATTNTLAFSTAGAERIRITSTGNVGIGDNNPTLDLVLFRNTASAVAARLQNSGSGSIYFSFLRTATQDWNLGLKATDSNKFQISSTAGLGTPRLTITTGGLVGITSTAPASILHVEQTNSAGGTKLIVHNPSTTNGSWSEIDFSLASASAEVRGGKIQLVGDSISAGTYSMRFLASGGFAAPTEKMRLFGPGGLAIGATTLTASTLLDVNGIIRSATGFRTGNFVGITDTFYFEDYYAQQCYIQTSGGIIIGMGFI
jgi:hypothetical protein